MSTREQREDDSFSSDYDEDGRVNIYSKEKSGKDGIVLIDRSKCDLFHILKNTCYEGWPKMRARWCSWCRSLEVEDKR